MASRHLSFILRHLRRTVGAPVSGAASDGQLLDRFTSQRDEAAFASLVQRHGPMVLGVCRRVLGDVHDAADTFQATFVVLARKAATIRKQESVGRWLYEVAYRLALKARTSALRRRNHETQAADAPFTEQANDLEWHELRLVLDEELHRLPEKYRGPLVLCYLEGKTNEEAAQELGWPVGSMSWRLGRARDLLRNQLARRGLALSTTLLGIGLAEKASAAVPAELAAMTVASVAAGSIPAPVSALADDMLRSLAIDKTRRVAVLVLALSVVGIVAGAIVRQIWFLPHTAVSTTQPEDAPATQLARPEPARMPLLNLTGLTPQVNKAGSGYPTYLDNRDGPRKEGGVFTVGVDERESLSGRGLRLRLTEGNFHCQFNPYDGAGRTFARDYCADPAGWRFNTYNRLRIWIKLPDLGDGPRRDGGYNFDVGVYIKRVQNANRGSDEDGGNHYHHYFNVPAVGQWTQLLVNMHPKHSRTQRFVDPGNLQHPTGEPEYNYFDTLTRLFICDSFQHTRYPVDYFLDNMEFYQEPFAENDQQIYALSSTYVREKNRLIVTWNRHCDDQVAHEVRYAFENVHRIGWNAAKTAPNGTAAPLGESRANGMLYDTTELPLEGRRVVYIAIKPQNAATFSQIAVPLKLGK